MGAGHNAQFWRICQWPSTIGPECSIPPWKSDLNSPKIQEITLAIQEIIDHWGLIFRRFHTLSAEYPSCQAHLLVNSSLLDTNDKAPAPLREYCQIILEMPRQYSPDITRAMKFLLIYDWTHLFGI